MRITVMLVAISVLALGCCAPKASADPFLTARLLGSTTGPDGAFSSSIHVSAGDTVNYQVQITLGAEGAHNTTAGATITDWVPSNAATSPTSGLQSLLFSLTQSGADSIQSNFSGGVSGTTTGGGTWGAGTGSATGTPTARGNGNNNLLNVRLIRETGNYDGVAGTPIANGEADPTPAVLETLTIGTGSFIIESSGTSGTVNLDLTGFAASQTIATIRWRVSASQNTYATAMENVGAENASVTNGDPIIIFQPLQLVPEPSSLGVLNIGALGLLRRRRRRWADRKAQ